MRVCVTGSGGFIGRNLVVRLGELGIEVIPFVHSMPWGTLPDLLSKSDAVLHLAGVNRAEDPADFAAGNDRFTEMLCDSLEAAGRPLPLIYASSIQAENQTAYGRSKLAAERSIEAYASRSKAPVEICRLPNVFGKWSRPNHNSVVATFCHHIARGLPIEIHDPRAVIRLAYVDDVIDRWVKWLSSPPPGLTRPQVTPEYKISVGDLAALIRSFHSISKSNTVPDVGIGLTRALYATYVSFLDPEHFSYPLIRHEDSRGVFVEFLKTDESGQFSYFTAHPGITRGGHYHHSKTEKFLVLKGSARFRFRNLLTEEFYALETSGNDPVVVQTIPGWTHDITNIGDEEMVVMLWANEIFDRDRPDTIGSEVSE